MTDRETRQVDPARRTAVAARNGAGGWSIPPVERASTILFDNVDELERARPGLGQYNYGLQGTATHWALVRSADRA